MALVKPYSHYSGVSAQGRYAGPAPTYTEPANRTVHVADPAHGQDAQDPNPVWLAPSLPPVDQVGEYPGSEWVMTGGVIEMDLTPRTHDQGGGNIEMTTSARAQAALSAIEHGTDYGASDKGTWAPPPVTFHTERQDYVRVPGNGAGDDISVSAVALQRGLNSLPENNPEGYRAGEVQWERPDRKFPIALERNHDHRVLVLNIAEGGGADIPAQGGSYPLTFDSLARAITDIAARPAIRREPIGIGESELTDGALDSYNIAPSATVGRWVVG